MKRREFITLLGGAAAAWPLAARAQQPAMPVVGFLQQHDRSLTATHLVTAFRQGLKEAGFVEGQNVAIEYRWADDQPDRLPALVADLVRRPVAVIVAATRIAALAAKAATTTMPIVFATGGDPVEAGPGRQPQPAGRQRHGRELLRRRVGGEAAGAVARARAQGDDDCRAGGPDIPDSRGRSDETCRPRRKRSGSNSSFSNVSSDSDIDAAFATLVQRGAGALLVGGGPFFNSASRNDSSRWRLATRCRRSTTVREFVEAGGLMSYGTSITDAYRQAGVYAGRILKGEKPADLPVMQSDQVRAGDQPQDRQGARPRRAADAARPRRRGDRVRRRDSSRCSAARRRGRSRRVRSRPRMPAIGILDVGRTLPDQVLVAAFARRIERIAGMSTARTSD